MELRATGGGGDKEGSGETGTEESGETGREGSGETGAEDHVAWGESGEVNCGLLVVAGEV